MKFKKLLIMSSALVCGLTLAACNKATSTATTKPTGSTTTVEDGKEYLTGIGYQATWDASKQQFSVAAAMVVFDENQTIQEVKIDEMQAPILLGSDKKSFTWNIAEDKKATKLDAKGDLLTKNEQGAAYGKMPKGSFDQQIAKFEDYAIGKKVSDIYTTLGTSTALPKDEGNDLQTEVGVSINVKMYTDAIAKAWENKNADSFKASKYDVGVSLHAYFYNSVEVTIDICGAVTSEDKILAASIDSVVATYMADKDGNIIVEDEEKKTVTLNTNSKYVKDDVFSSKKTLKEDYGMQAYAKATEWYLQAAEIEKACVGKTAAQVRAMVKGEGDLAGATINLTTYTDGVAQAAEYSKKEFINR